MTPNFFQAATLKKIWVEATVKKPQVAPYKNLGRFYRVPFKSLLRVQIKWVNKIHLQSSNTSASILFTFFRQTFLHLSNLRIVKYGA